MFHVCAEIRSMFAAFVLPLVGFGVYFALFLLFDINVNLKRANGNVVGFQLCVSV